MQLTIFSRARQLGFLALLLATVASTGCGKTGKVTGTVTYIDDKPLGGGKIFFVKEGSKEAKDSKSVEIQSDGTYTIEAPIGTCKVYFSTDYLLGDAMAATGVAPIGPAALDTRPLSEDMKNKLAEEKATREKAKEEAEAKSKAYRELPPSYAKLEDSPVKCDVHKGSQTFDVKIEQTPGWKPGDLSKRPKNMPGGGGAGPGGMIPPGR